MTTPRHASAHFGVVPYGAAEHVAWLLREPALHELLDGRELAAERRAGAWREHNVGEPADYRGRRRERGPVDHVRRCLPASLAGLAPIILRHDHAAALEHLHAALTIPPGYRERDPERIAQLGDYCRRTLRRQGMAKPYRERAQRTLRRIDPGAPAEVAAVWRPVAAAPPADLSTSGAPLAWSATSAAIGSYVVAPPEPGWPVVGRAGVADPGEVALHVRPATGLR